MSPYMDALTAFDRAVAGKMLPLTYSEQKTISICLSDFFKAAHEKAAEPFCDDVLYDMAEASTRAQELGIDAQKILKNLSPIH